MLELDFPLCHRERFPEPPAVMFLDLSLPSPAENLALDEALLDLCDTGGPESLRFWESPVPFVVVGYGNRIATEVNVTACEATKTQVLRRCSGGGTVVQGPGCLNYNLVLRIPEAGPLTHVTGTNRFIMERMRDALQPLVADRVIVEGHTDLAMERDAEVLKFSGNAQRRRRHAIVFHGTLLLDFDLEQISRLLLHPSTEPGYRIGRHHRDFITNLNLPRESIVQSVAKAWAAAEPLEALPELAAVSAKYLSREWNERL
jgi:lipoate-protein ligase A